MSEKLLPIVAGCQALVIKADQPGVVGKTVTVLSILTSTADVLHSGIYWQVPQRNVGRWLCEFADGSFPINVQGTPCPVGAFKTSSLMRIDGGGDLPVDSSDIPLNMPQDWRDRNKAGVK